MEDRLHKMERMEWGSKFSNKPLWGVVGILWQSNLALLDDFLTETWDSTLRSLLTEGTALGSKRPLLRTARVYWQNKTIIYNNILYIYTVYIYIYIVYVDPHSSHEQTGQYHNS